MHLCFAEHDKLEFAEGIKRVTASYSHIFDKIIVHTLNGILCFSLREGIFVHSLPFMTLTIPLPYMIVLAISLNLWYCVLL